MLGKRKTQGSFTEMELARRRRACTWLKEVDELMNWRPMEHQLKKLYPSHLGRPSYPPLAMFKALLLAQWYDLSDPELEEQLLDRRSFQEFCAFGVLDEIPDETSFVVFRQRLMERGLDKKMFEYINRQIEAAGCLLKRGTLVDATLIAAAVKKPPKAAEGEEQRSNDPEAGWGVKKGQQPIYGYKIHVGADAGSQIIRKIEVTPGNVGDTDCFDALLSGDERSVFADKGYMKMERVRALRARGIYAAIMRKGYRNTPLKQSCIRRNRIFAGIRAPIEGLFGRAKRLYGVARTRYLGLRKNLLKAHMLAISMNLDRWRALAYA
jgi:IS5 family transposase